MKVIHAEDIAGIADIAMFGSVVRQNKEVERGWFKSVSQSRDQQ